MARVAVSTAPRSCSVTCKDVSDKEIVEESSL